MKKLQSRILTTVFLILMITSTISATTNSSLFTANAQTTQTTIPSDMLQYEWTMDAASATRSNFGSGPAPNVPNIQWATTIPNIYSGVGPGLVAFNGLLFVQTYSPYNTIALNAVTGNIVWNISASGNIVKLDSTYMLIGSNCYKISDGSLVWNGPAGFAQTQSTRIGVSYIPDLKILVNGGKAWSIPTPSQAPTSLWNRTGMPDFNQYGYEIEEVYGQGIIVYSAGGYLGLSFWKGVNATNGKTLWTTPSATHVDYGMSYFDGEFIHGGSDGNMRAWNITTGELIWTYNPGTFYNAWAWCPAVAYGMVYEHNQDTYVYAINATTGKLVWKQSGPGIGYSNYLTVADGKVFVNMGENQYRDPATGQYGHDEFDALDAYTGQRIWTAPFANGAPWNNQVNAYGNLYVVSSHSSSNSSGYIYPGIMGAPVSEIWCISNTPKDWSMFLSDPMHSAFGYGPTNLTLNWKFATGAEIVSSPTFVNGKGYIGSEDGNIYSFDATTGAQIWNVTTGFPVLSTLAIANGRLYTGAESGNISCFDAANGNLLWKTSTPGITSLVSSLSPTVLGPPATSSPIVYNGNVYVGGANRVLYCLNANSGTITWQLNTGGRIYATPTIVDNALYITSSVSSNGTLLKLDPATGNVIFNATIPYARVNGVVRTFAGSMIASPTVANGMVFVRTGAFSNFALDAKTGAIIWEYDEMINTGTPSQNGGTTSFGAPLYINGLIYINDFYGISAINATNGNRVWHSYTSREDITEGLTYSYGGIYTVNQAGILHVLDPATGKSLFFYGFGVQVCSIPTTYNGSLYVATNDWNLYCFGEAPPVTMISTDISFELRPSSIVKGETVIVAGSINNVHSAVPMNVYFSKGDSSLPVNITAITDGNGGFTVKYTPDMVGDWTVVASWSGDATHSAGSSQSQTLTVVEPSTPQPTQALQSAADLYFVPGIIGVIVAIIVVGVILAILMLRKRP